jgi:coenzyme F420-0:L-glutamate ligase/coenzyme F420-1:gamma-L-glutamate ligase
MSEVVVVPVTGIGEVSSGDDLATLLHEALADGPGLNDGDIVVVTSKVVSKAEGQVQAVDRTVALATETDRVVARRGPVTIARTHHGLVMANAGIDASNVPPGSLVLLPRDPDATARALRERLAGQGANVAVLVSDTSGRAWRNGQTDIAVGAAGLEVVRDFAGILDGYGNELAVTAPAVADEIASAADLVKGKLARVPVAVVRGLGHLVLPRGSHGPGAAALLRGEGTDMFGHGTRDAVVRAVTADQTQRRGFGDPAEAEDLAAALLLLPDVVEAAASGASVVVRIQVGSDIALGRVEARLLAVAFAFGWQADDASDRTVLRLRPVVT